MNVTTSTASLTPIDISGLRKEKLPDDALQQMLAGMPEPAPVGQVNADNDPKNLYATIQKNGKTIATVYRSGLLVTPNGEQLPADLVSDGATPLSVADARIRQMLAMHGGTVNYAQSMRAVSTPASAATLFAAQLAGQ